MVCTSGGDFVWLESDENIVTLEKTFDAASGMVRYTAPDLVLADYVPNNIYDLHTQGEEGGIGEYLLPDESRPLPLLFGVPRRTPAALADCG